MILVAKSHLYYKNKIKFLYKNHKKSKYAQLHGDTHLYIICKDFNSISLNIRISSDDFDFNLVFKSY